MTEGIHVFFHTLIRKSAVRYTAFCVAAGRGLWQSLHKAPMEQVKVRGEDIAK